MAQRLRMRNNKSGNSKGVAIRKTNATKNINVLQNLLNLTYKRSKRNNGKSKNKNS